MAVLQLVRTGDGPTSRIVPKENPDQIDPDDFETVAGMVTVDAGSDLLIRFANSLSHAGFRLVDIGLVDRYFNEVREPAAETTFASQLADFLLLVAQDYEAARQFRQGVFPDYFVSNVRLRNLQTGNIVILGQEGVVHADLEEIEFLTKGLNTA